jgi:hypothetical protein
MEVLEIAPLFSASSKDKMLVCIFDGFDGHLMEGSLVSKFDFVLHLC